MSIRTERDERDYQADHYRTRLETKIIIITVIIPRGVWVLYICTIIVRFPSLPLACYCCYHSERDDEITLKIICIGTRRAGKTIVVGRSELRKTSTIYHTIQGDYFICKNILLFRKHLT